MKQTATEWLNIEINKFNIIPNDKNELLIFKGDLEKLINNAKEIEKQQIIDAVNQHDKKCINISNNLVKKLNPKFNGGLFEYGGDEGEKYYKQKYENE